MIHHSEALEQLSTDSPLSQRISALQSEAAYLEIPSTKNALLDQAASPDARSVSARAFRYPPLKFSSIFLNMKTGALFFGGVVGLALLAFSLLSQHPAGSPSDGATSQFQSPNATTWPNPPIGKEQPKIGQTRIATAFNQTPAGVFDFATRKDIDSILTMDVGGITPIEPTEDQLAKMAITLDDEGTISFTARGKFSSRPSVERHDLLPEIGMSTTWKPTHESEAAAANESLPRVVTNTDGTIRYLQFDTHEYSSAAIREVLHVVDTASHLLGHIEISFLTIGPTISGSGPVTDAGAPPPPHPLSLNDPAAPHLRSEENPNVHISGSHFALYVGGGSVSIAPVDDSATARVKLSNETQTSDQGTTVVHIRRIPDNDSLVSGVSNLLPSNRDHSKTASTRSSNSPNWDSIFSEVIKDARALQPDINRLIPVLVRNHRGAKPNDVILWYEPSEDLTRRLSATTVSSSISPAHPSGALKELAINPNPAGNTAAIHFTLTETRDLKFVIYTLVGDKVIEIGRIVHQSGGSGSITANFENVRNGAYLLVASTEKGEQMTIRFLVEK